MSDEVEQDSNVDEVRRIGALDYARSVQHNSIDEYLNAALRVEEYLKTGSIDNQND